MQSTTVDSKPISVASPIRMQSTRPLRSSNTACQVVGLGLPDKLADGATIGVSHSLINVFAIVFFGILTPIVESPADASEETVSLLGNTTVSGPGKNVLIKDWAVSGIEEATSEIWHGEATCTIKGLSDGRRLAANIFSIARSSKTFAPRPYTVSVGKATIPPAEINRAASVGESVTSVFIANDCLMLELKFANEY